MFLSRGERDLGVAFQTHPGRQASISRGSKEPRSALESRRVSLGAHWVEDLLGGGDVMMIGRKIWDDFGPNQDWPMAAAVAVSMVALLVAPIVLLYRARREPQRAR